jgi:methionyl-tRNA formyltransferase
MNVSIFTTSDRIYLPKMFDTILSVHGSSIRHVYIVPPLYKDQTYFSGFMRFKNTFGYTLVFKLFIKLVFKYLKGISIQSICEKYNVHYEIVNDLNSPTFLENQNLRESNLFISISCPQIFSNNLINIPNHGCFNVHGSILPSYRGVLPSFWMMLNREKFAGVTIFKMNEGIDTGMLIKQQTFNIQKFHNLHDLIIKSKHIAGQLVVDLVDQFISNKHPEEIRSKNVHSSYYSWPKKKDYILFRKRGYKFY